MNWMTLTSVGYSDDSRFDHQTSQSVEDAAAALGELFAQQLPAAQALIDDLARQHPGADAEGRFKWLRRGTETW